MRNDSDPLERRTTQLAEALTTARSRSQSRSGLLWVEACADGDLTIRIDDHALSLGGDELSRQLTALAARALADAREQARTALTEFRADPHFDATVGAIRDAMNNPLPQQSAG
ncbi:hypothetical protein [Nocardia crassostreae]|uniref:hypothetical protein n=1 Tax=Nocardia crassostreae TaxID=53428 RepID=UPI00082D4F53|nr:hypothetical protein [Nocardia crassostreae]